MYVCQSVTALLLKYTGLRIVYKTFRHVALKMQLHAMAALKWRSRRTEVDARTSPEI